MTDAAPHRPHSVTSAAARLSGAQRRRSLVAAIVSAACVGLTIGMAVPLMSLVLEYHAVPPSQIGLVAAAPALAVLCMSPFVPRILDRLGLLQAIYLSIVVFVVITLILPLWISPLSWFGLRFLVGAAIAVHWIATETWILAVAAEGKRGRTISLYMTAIAGGFAAGPLMIELVGVEGWLPFLTVAGLILLSAMPLPFARNAMPVLPPRQPAAFGLAFRTAPLIMSAAALAGFTDAAVVALLPVYGLKVGLSQDIAVRLLTVMLVGSLVLQLPIGWLADRMGSRPLIIAFAGIFLLAPPLLPLALNQTLWQWPLLVIWGGASIGIYTLALTAVAERFPAAALAGANAAMVALYETGSVLGPFAGGSLMQVGGAEAFLYGLSAAAALFLFLALARSFQRSPRIRDDGR